VARVFITGSSDGLGLLAGRRLAEAGHAVTLHARNRDRAVAAREALPAAEDIVIGDVSTLEAIRSVAEQAEATGRFDAVIHNVGIGSNERRRAETADGLSQLFVVNVLAPYLLTAMVTAPQRLVYLSSGMHRGGSPGFSDLQWDRRRWNGPQAYSDSKWLDVALAFAVARLWPGVLSNAVNPGWVPTRMGGRGAPDSLELGAATQAWLAVSDQPDAHVSGQYFFHQQPQEAHPATRSAELQQQLVQACAQLTGTDLPASRTSSQ
jgi:NAD(P)-dependent dehydrogenase (short-subunit alcohol dehydrogenase family)